MPTTVYDKSATLAGTDDGANDTSVNFRVVHKAAVLGAATGTQARITFLFGVSSASVSNAVSSVEIGQAAAAGHEYDLNGNQVQVLFGGVGTLNSSAGGTFVSDWVTLGEAYDNTKNYVVAFHMINSATPSLAEAAVTNVDLFFDGGGTDNSSTSVVTLGNTVANTASAITKIEIQAAGGSVPYNPWPQAAPLLAQ